VLPAELGSAALLEAIQALVLVLDSAGRVLYLNHACKRLSGGPAVEVLGLKVEELPFLPEVADREAFARMVVAPATTRHRGPWVCPDGRRIHIEWSTVPISGATGARYVVCTGVEVATAEPARQDSQEQLHFLQTILDSIPNPVFYKSVDGRYRGCNRAFEQMAGQTREQLAGKSIGEFAPQEMARHYEQKDRELFRLPGTQHYEWAIRYASGEVRDVIIYKATYTDSYGVVAGLVGVVLDITEQKRAERELQQARDELEVRVQERTAELRQLKEAAEAADRTKSEFLNIASHELRTPLTALRLVLQQARRDLAANRFLTDTALSRMERHSGRLARMAGELLEASRLEHGRLHLHRGSVDLRVLVTEVVEDFRLQGPGQRLEVVLPETPVWVNIDRDRIEQVLANLLDNAIKYTPTGTAVHIHLVAHAEAVRLSISDEGPGITPEEQAQLFKRFHRLSSSIHQAGLGLGLYISKEIVEQHGGSLSFRSEPGQSGAAFIIELPREC
jgi:PAS domain S-box-containing protein